MTAPPIRVALILSGGSSLGAYVGGAVSEILAALTRGEGSTGERSRGEGSGGDGSGGEAPRAELHVIAGSSAGAVTAALAARAMTVNPELLPFIRKLWVEALDAKVLLDAGRPNRAGVLSGAGIEELSRALITGDSASDDRRATGVADTLSVGMTLSNLTGVPHELRYRFQNAPERSCGVRVHRDSIAFDLAAPVGADDPVWEEIRRASLASAAFPFAFPPIRMLRASGDYPQACFPNGAAEREQPMWFADGGLFANEPIGLAKRLASRTPGHRSAEWRYVLVDPDLTDTALPGPPSTLPGVAGAITRAVLGQGAATDWARATDTNARLALFEAIVARLPEIADGLCDPEALGLGQQVAQLAERVAESELEEDRTTRSGERTGVDEEDAALERLDSEVARIESDPRFGGAFERIDTRAGRTRIAKLIYVLESAANLQDKQILPLYLVAPADGERLAGSFFGNFGGFLEEKWRAHDFEAGRRDAGRLLARHFRDVLEYDRDPDSFEVDDSVDASFATAGPEARARIEAFVDAETKRVLDSVEPGLLIRAFGWLWKPAVRAWVRRWALGVLEN